MKILKIIAVLIVALALPVAAYAQDTTRGLDRKKEKDESAADLQKRKAEEKLYNNSLSNITTKEYDPWASVREKAPVEKPPAPKKKPPVRPFVQ